MDRDFMREGEPLFDWEKVVIEKRRRMILKQPSFEERPKEFPPAVPEESGEGRGLLGLFQGLFQKRQPS